MEARQAQEAEATRQRQHDLDLEDRRNQAAQTQAQQAAAERGRQRTLTRQDQIRAENNARDAAWNANRNNTTPAPYGGPQRMGPVTLAQTLAKTYESFLGTGAGGGGTGGTGAAGGGTSGGTGTTGGTGTGAPTPDASTSLVQALADRAAKDAERQATERAAMRAQLQTQITDASKPVDANSEGIKGTLAAQRLSRQRAEERQRSQLAARLSQEGLLDSGAFDTGVQGIAQARGEGESADIAAAVQPEQQAQKARLLTLLQMAQAQGDTEAAQTLQAQLAAIDATNQQTSRQEQSRQFNASLGQQRDSALNNLRLQLLLAGAR